MSDGHIRISIEIDGKEVNVASKELEKLEEVGHKSGKGIKSAESSMDSLNDSSSRAAKGVKGTSDAVDDLGDKSSRTSKDLKGADGAIDDLADSSSSASKGVKGTSDSLDNLSDSAGDAANQTKKAKDEASELGDQTDRASDKTKSLAKSLGLVAIAAASFKILKASMDDAIKRFDTLNKFPKILGEMGVSADDAEKAMGKLSDGIDGLPTTLDDISASTLDMYSSFQDIDKATDTALALNNALLGSGASAEQAKRGTQQYSKALQTDQMYLSTWNTLQETMGVGLIKIAEGFGYAGKSAKNDLYNALQDGTVTMDEFNDKLIEVGTGTGIMAKLAKENSLGIETSLGNLRNAAARGIADVIDSFNKLSVSVTGKDIAQNIDSLKHVVNASFKTIGSVIEGTTPIVIFFADGVKAVIPLVETLTPAIVGLMTAYAAHAVITKAGTAIGKSNQVLAIAQASQKALTIAKVTDTATTAAQTGAISLQTAIIGVLTGKMKLSTAATIAKTVATNLLGAALRFLSGPVGWIVTGIGALVTATVAVVKWFKRSTEEAKRLKGETEDLGNATEQLNEDVEQSAISYQEQQRELQASADANANLAEKVEELANKENKSAAEKQMLNDYVGMLNDSMEGLNLSYNEEADALSMSSEEIATRVDLMGEQASYNDALERQVEIMKEQSEVEQQLGEINELRAEWNQKLEEGSVKSKEHKEAIGELEEQEESLKATLVDLTEQYGVTESEIDQAMASMAEATENGVMLSTDAINEWIEKNEELVENMNTTYNDILDITTNAFDKISEESKASADEMIENLQHNQKMTEEWGTNISELYEYASKNGHEGFLHWLEQLGPDSAAEIAEIRGMSDAELKEFAELMDKGADVATDSFKTSLGEGMEDAFNAMEDVITSTPATLRQSIKNADFESVGTDLTDGLADGIDKGSSVVEKSATDMAEKTTLETKKAFETRSPSKVYKEIGGDLTDGLALGLNQGTPAVMQSVQKMFNNVRTRSMQQLKTLNNNFRSQTNAIKNMMVSQFRSIGVDSMAGLNAGLIAGRPRVLSTARSIANSVASTMRRALDTHSPSRVTERIGEDTGDGFIGGLLSRVGNIENASMKLAYAAIPTMRMGTPEMTLGTSRMAYAEVASVSPVSSAPTQNSNGGNNAMLNALKEQTNILAQIAKKDPNLYVSGEKLTDVVNENNALIAMNTF